jgi:hypothetical protein
VSLCAIKEYTMGLSFLDKFKKEAAKLETVGVGIRTTEEILKKVFR